MEIVISNMLTELLMRKSEEQETTVEEIIEQAIRKYIGRNDENVV